MRTPMPDSITIRLAAALVFAALASGQSTTTAPAPQKWDYIAVDFKPDLKELPFTAEDYSKKRIERLNHYASKGWQVFQNLDDNRYILKRPTTHIAREYAFHNVMDELRAALDKAMAAGRLDDVSIYQGMADGLNRVGAQGWEAMDGRQELYTCQRVIPAPGTARVAWEYKVLSCKDAVTKALENANRFTASTAARKVLLEALNREGQDGWSVLKSNEYVYLLKRPKQAAPTKKVFDLPDLANLPKAKPSTQPAATTNPAATMPAPADARHADSDPYVQELLTKLDRLNTDGWEIITLVHIKAGQQSYLRQREQP